jgi:amino acid transporter
MLKEILESEGTILLVLAVVFFLVAWIICMILAKWIFNKTMSHLWTDFKPMGLFTFIGLTMTVSFFGFLWNSSNTLPKCFVQCQQQIDNNKRLFTTGQILL